LTPWNYDDVVAWLGRELVLLGLMCDIRRNFEEVDGVGAMDLLLRDLG
jgi:hypothetical protein